MDELEFYNRFRILGIRHYFSVHRKCKVCYTIAIWIIALHVKNLVIGLQEEFVEVVRTSELIT